MKRPRLSAAVTSRQWIKQFSPADQGAAINLVDALLLMNEEDVSSEIRKQLQRLAQTRSGARKKIGLYAEREFAEKLIFKSKLTKDSDNRERRRAYGNTGPKAVNPIRGKTRVGSEGPAAFHISQGVEKFRSIFLNNPGPDRIRRNKVSMITIVTDFIGSGSRVISMIDKFLNVPSVQAWRSKKWIEFSVVAAASTISGIKNIEEHKSKPEIFVSHIAPSISTYHNLELAERWKDLIRRYGPRSGRGSGSLGYKDGGALIAFSYRFPNNAPLIFHESTPKWQPLFTGGISPDMAPAFGIKTENSRAVDALNLDVMNLPSDIIGSDARMIVILKAIRGRWRKGQEVALAEKSGLSVPEILDSYSDGKERGFLTEEGRLTDRAHQFMRSSLKLKRSARTLPINEKPYYPQALRVPTEV